MQVMRIDDGSIDCRGTGFKTRYSSREIDGQAREAVFEEEMEMLDEGWSASSVDVLVCLSSSIGRSGYTYAYRETSASYSWLGLSLLLQIS